MWPTSITAREALLIPINNFRTKLVGDINAVQTSVQLLSIINDNSIQIPASGVVSIDDEVIFYNGINTGGANPTLLNCVRGYDNTKKRPHITNADVEVRWIAAHHNGLANELHNLMTKLGVNALSSTQQRGGGAAAYTSLTDKLANTAPELIALSGDTWEISHTRRRVVMVQLWEYDSGSDEFHLFEANMRQDVDPSGAVPSKVFIEPFEASKEGFAIIA